MLLMEKGAQKIGWGGAVRHSPAHVTAKIKKKWFENASKSVDFSKFPSIPASTYKDLAKVDVCLSR